MGLTATGSLLLLFCGAVLGAPTTTKSTSSCTACPPGLGVARKCTGGQDTVCVPCKPGTYSKKLSTLEPCSACSRCGQHLFELHPCSATSDVFCELCSRSKSIPNTDYQRKCLSDDKGAPSAGSQVGLTEKKTTTKPSVKRTNFNKQVKHASHLGFLLRVGGIDPPNAPKVDHGKNTSKDIYKNITKKGTERPVIVPTKQGNSNPIRKVSTDIESGINIENNTSVGGGRETTVKIPRDSDIYTTAPPAGENDHDTVATQSPSETENETTKSSPDIELKSNATVLVTVRSGIETNQTISKVIEPSHDLKKTELEKNQSVASVHIATGLNTTLATKPTTVRKDNSMTNLSSADVPVVPVLDNESTHVLQTVKSKFTTTTTLPTTKIAIKVKTTATKMSEKTTAAELIPTPNLYRLSTVATRKKMTDFKIKGPKTTMKVSDAVSGVLSPRPDIDVKVGAVANTGNKSSTFGIVAAALTAAIVFFAIGFFVNRFGTRKGFFRPLSPSPAPSPPLRIRGPLSENNHQETALTQPVERNHVREPTPEAPEAPEETDESEDSDKEEEMPLTVAVPDTDPMGPDAGSNQSPVDINPDDAVIDETLEKTPLFINYKAEYKSTITNTGDTVRIDMNGNSCELSEGPLLYKYQLHHVVFHWGAISYHGSEHTVNGRSFAGEIQLVHWNTDEYSSYGSAEISDDGLAIMSVFMKVGEGGEEDDEGLKRLTDCLPSIQYMGESREPPSNFFDPSILVPENTREYWTYQGSTTVEPFSESVSWIIFKDPLIVSEEQMEEFRKLVYHKKNEKYLLSAPDDAFIVDNFRLVQPLGDRQIYASFD